MSNTLKREKKSWLAKFQPGWNHKIILDEVIVSPEIYYDHTDIIRHIQTQPYDGSIQLTMKGQHFNWKHWTIWISC